MIPFHNPSPTVRVAKRLMALMPGRPDRRTLFDFVRRLAPGELPDDARRSLFEVARQKFEIEDAVPFFETYFGSAVANELRGTSVLDLGCSVGGRGVAWQRKFGFKAFYSVDILQQDLVVAREFAETKNVAGRYVCGTAEALPFHAGSLDNVLSYDTFEHVRDLRATLDECYRVLVPGGRLFAVLPQFHNPIESHLVVTRTPCLHWFFGGDVLMQAQHSLSVGWGWPDDLLPSSLEAWERLPSLNGVTVAGFERLIRDGKWEVASWRLWPFPTTGRRARTLVAARAIRAVCSGLVRVAGVREYVTDRVACILRKPVE